MYKLIEELIQKVEMIAEKFAFLVPSFLHFLILNPWIWMKDNIDNIVNGVEGIINKVLDTAKERFPNQYEYVAKYADKTLLKAKEIEKRGEETVESLHTSYKAIEKRGEETYQELKARVADAQNRVAEGVADAKNKVTEVKNKVTEEVVYLEKTVIHPTAIGVAEHSKPYILKAIEIVEPTITRTKPVWEPIADRVLEVNSSVVHNKYVGPIIDKFETVVGDTVSQVMQYCNVELSQ